MKKIVMTTSMALVAVQAMASATEINKTIEDNGSNANSQNINQQLKSVFDKQRFQRVYDGVDGERLNAKMTNIYAKKAVREALEQTYPVIVGNYGENGQVLYDKYFQDIQDKVRKVTSPTRGTGNQDSTSLGPQATDYDNCYTNPTKTGENLAPAGMGCICHGACHGQCHGSGCALGGGVEILSLTLGHNLGKKFKRLEITSFTVEKRKPQFWGFSFPAGYRHYFF